MRFWYSTGDEDENFIDPTSCDAENPVTTGGILWLDCCDGQYLYTDAEGTTHPTDGQAVIRGINRFGPSDGSEDWHFFNGNGEDIHWNLNFNSKGSVEVYQRGGSTATLVIPKDFSAGTIGNAATIIYPQTQFVVLRYVTPTPRSGELQTVSSVNQGSDRVAYWTMDNAFRTRTMIFRILELENMYVAAIQTPFDTPTYQTLRWNNGVSPWEIDGWEEGTFDHQETYTPKAVNPNFSQLGEVSENVNGALHADVAEYIGYNRALSDSEVDEVNSYLALKWGIS